MVHPVFWSALADLTPALSGIFVFPCVLRELVVHKYRLYHLSVISMLTHAPSHSVLSFATRPSTSRIAPNSPFCTLRPCFVNSLLAYNVSPHCALAFSTRVTRFTDHCALASSTCASSTTSHRTLRTCSALLAPRVLSFTAHCALFPRSYPRFSHLFSQLALRVLRPTAHCALSSSTRAFCT